MADLFGIMNVHELATIQKNCPQCKELTFNCCGYCKTCCTCLGTEQFCKNIVATGSMKSLTNSTDSNCSVYSIDAIDNIPPSETIKPRLHRSTCMELSCCYGECTEITQNVCGKCNKHCNCHKHK